MLAVRLIYPPFCYMFMLLGLGVVSYAIYVHVKKTIVISIIIVCVSVSCIYVLHGQKQLHCKALCNVTCSH